MGAIVSLGLLAQAIAPPSFEVASVKSNKSGSGSSWDRFCDGRFIASNVTLHHCIQLAYGVKEYQISGPAWLSSERYDIEAKTDSPVPPDQQRTMLQTLLADRFKLKLHRDVKQLRVYVLVAGRRGFKLHAVEPGPERDRAGQGFISGQKMPLSRLADKLSQVLDRPVLNRTEIGGVFDIELKWDRDGSDDASSVFAAVEEQLGLKLESRKGPVEILVVDQAEKVPTEN
jgi:uncharacterized protein (TIGR03435 family)